MAPPSPNDLKLEWGTGRWPSPKRLRGCICPGPGLRLMMTWPVPTRMRQGGSGGGGRGAAVRQGCNGPTGEDGLAGP